MDVKDIVTRLGGPGVVAGLCECTPQAVSRWYTVYGFIPNARLLHLKAIRPDVFGLAPARRPSRRVQR